MRSAIALIAAGWFVAAAIINSFSVPGGELSAVLEALRAMGQTLFVGLAILSLTMVDWRDVLDFFLVDLPTRTTRDEGPSDD